jgi:hypothetical protein
MKPALTLRVTFYSQIDLTLFHDSARSGGQLLYPESLAARTTYRFPVFDVNMACAGLDLVKRVCQVQQAQKFRKLLDYSDWREHWKANMEVMIMKELN